MKMQPGTKTLHLAGQKRVVSERQWREGAVTHRTELRQWTETSLDAPGIPRMYIRKKVARGDQQLLILHVPGFQRFGGRGMSQIYQPSEVWVFLAEESLPRPKFAPPGMIGTVVGSILLEFSTGQSLRKALDFAEAYANQWHPDQGGSTP